MASEESKALHSVGDAVRQAAHGAGAAHDAMVESASDPRKNDLSGVAPHVAKAFCVEQLHIDPEWCRVIKDCEKAVMRKASAEPTTHELIQACSNWFTAAYLLQQSRLAREEAWKAEFTGRKGDLHAIFDQIDVDGASLTPNPNPNPDPDPDFDPDPNPNQVDGDGTITLVELQGFFAEFGGALPSYHPSQAPSRNSEVRCYVT